MCRYSFNHAPVWPGYVSFKNGDTLYGLTKVVSYVPGYYILPLGKDEVQKIDVYKTDVIHISTPFLNDTCFNLVNVYGGIYVWRLLMRTYNKAIYDNLNQPVHGLFGQKMLLVKNSKATKLYSGMAWFMHNGNVNALLLKFINRHFRASFKKQDFPSTPGMLRYILDHA